MDKKILRKNLYNIVSEFNEYTDKNAFVSDLSLSSMWGEPDEVDDNDLNEIVKYIGNVWDVLSMNMLDIVKASGLTQLAFSQYYCIPLRTLENWCANARTQPMYLQLLIASDLNLM